MLLSPPRARLRLAVAVGLTGALAAGLLSAAPTATADPAGEQRLADLVQGERDARGLAPLRVCEELNVVARRWSARMATDGRASHNPHFTREVTGWHSVGENVGYGPTVDAVHQIFMGSEAHRAKILSGTYTEVGFGVENRNGRVWVTEVFRQPDGSAPCSPVAADPRVAAACPPAAVPSAGFVDTHGNVHRHAIDCGAWHGLVNGTSSRHYSPSPNLSRAQMAAFLTRLVEQTSTPLPPARDQGFTDVAGNYHADAINRLAGAGIVQGTSATTFAPSAAVTRAQMATMVVRAYEYASGEQLATRRDWFGDDNGSVHEPQINKAAAAGFVAGTSPDSYTPNRAVRRDQLASVLVRALNRLVERGEVTRP